MPRLPRLFVYLAGLVLLVFIGATQFANFQPVVPQPPPAIAKTVLPKGPLWSSTRAETPLQNAEAHWRKHGNEFPEFRTATDYIAGAHRFVANPPAGTLTKSRSDGDRLFYDPASNTFAVTNRKGVPRTFFRPRNGMAYWNRQ